MAVTDFSFSPSKVRHGDIYLAPGGDTWHQQSHLLHPMGEAMRWDFVFVNHKQMDAPWFRL